MKSLCGTSIMYSPMNIMSARICTVNIQRAEGRTNRNDYKEGLVEMSPKG